MNDVFKRFVEVGQNGENLIDHIGRPSIDFLRYVGVAPDHSFDRLFDDVGDFFDAE